MEEKEKKEQEDLSPEAKEVRKDVKKGKGYTTILADIVGALRKLDIKKAAKLREAKGQGLVKKFLKSLGWSEKEAATMEGEIEGKEQDDIAGENVINIETLKENEINVELNQKISGIEENSVIKFKGKDYLVLDIITNDQRQTTTYHLKEC